MICKLHETTHLLRRNHLPSWGIAMTIFLMATCVSSSRSYTKDKLPSAGGLRKPHQASIVVGRHVLEEARSPLILEEVKELQSGVALSNQKGDRDEVQVYRLPVPAMHKAECKTQGFKGDPDLYLRFGEVPDITFEGTDNTCTSAYEGSTETCITGSSGKDESLLYVALHAYEAYRGITLICTVHPYIDGQSPSEMITIKDEVLELEDGVAKVNQNGQKGEAQLYRLMVPAQSQVYCQLSGGKGDADLYMRFDALPEVSLASTNNDCVSTNDRSYEYCGISSSSDTNAILYVAVHAYESYDGLQVNCYTYANWGNHDDDWDYNTTYPWGKTRVPVPVLNEVVLELEFDITLTNQRGFQDAVQLYTLTVPPMHIAMCYLEAEANAGDADLYMRFGEIPEIRVDSSVNDCFSAWACYHDCFDSCEAVWSNNEETILYVAVHAYEAYRGLTIECLLYELPEMPVIKEEILELTMGIPLANQHGLKNEVQFYEVSAPDGNRVTCSTSGDAGDVDLHVRFDEMPSLDDIYVNDCTSASVGSNEECTASMYESSNTDSLVYVALYAYDDYENVTVVCTWSE